MKSTYSNEALISVWLNESTYLNVIPYYATNNHNENHMK